MTSSDDERRDGVTSDASAPAEPTQTTDTAPRVEVTPAAAALIASLVEEHGPVMFHQSGGCCDGSAPMCFLDGEFLTGPADVLLGTVAGAPFWIGKAQWERWAHTRLTVDVVPGRGSGFSLEAPRGVRFLLRSTVCLPPTAPGSSQPSPATPEEPSS